MTRLAVRRDWYPLIAGVLIVVGFELALILMTTHGSFTYTLDDPYIHLALAENLARFGHYGLNIEEYSSPSSSILWPLLLAPTLVVGLGAYGPLILNVMFAIATVLVIHQIIGDAASSPIRQTANVSWVWALLLFFAVNGFGIVFTGMEHSLHVLVTVSIMYFINRMQWAADKGIALPAEGHGDALLAVCIVLSPLIRFEGLAVSLFAVAMLIRFGKPHLAAISVVLVVVSLALYAYAMSALGLPLLPSSVLVKSRAAADAMAQTDIAGRLFAAASRAAADAFANLKLPEAQFLLATTVVVVLQSVRAYIKRERVSSIYVLGVVAVVSLHFAFGQFGWYARYQSYVCSFVICAALYVFSRLLSRHLHPETPVARERLAIYGAALGTCIALALGPQQNLTPFVTTPIAAQNIYEQQRQMHEFAVHHWNAPVAVNDVGYVGFENDEYVLDLWGLASEEARQLILTNDPERLRKLTDKHDVHLAMIYDELFPDVVPADWWKVAELNLSSKRITPAYERVSFYVIAVDRPRCRHVIDELMAFSRTLVRPRTLRVDIDACERPRVPPDGVASIEYN